MEVIWQHNSYSEGDEIELYKLVKKISEGKNINDNTDLNKNE
jgi:hypothetical protein